MIFRTANTFFLEGALIVILLGIIWLKEGWKRALKIIAYLIVLCMGLFIIGTLLKFDDGTFKVLFLILFGIYLVWFIFYCIKEGYITKF